MPFPQPLKLIQHIRHTQTAIVINDLDTDLPIVDDDLRQQSPQSLLALPIVNQGGLRGILDLRHQTVSGVFTPDHLSILNCLCTQAAISLSNARLFQASQQTALELQQANARWGRSD
jgi:GAF domain-containing protein